MKSRMAVFGIHFSSQDAGTLVELLTHDPLSTKNEAYFVFTANLDHIVKMRGHPDFRAAYRRAEIVTADGAPVYLYARWRGVPLPGRVTGSGLFPMLMSKLSPEKHRPFFVVSDHETAKRIEMVLTARGFKDLLTVVPPFGFDRDTDYSAQLARWIAEHGTTHLLFCVGAPKSELWLDRYRKEIGPCYALSLGAGANFFAGTDRRAPVWVQKCGAEWLWRFAREPRRLFRRYFIDSWAFLLAVADDLRHKKFQ